ncbi:4F2 cell-surface antigen heavy chain isoform X2 [Hemicordylus capensis]|nr:4F2 cell-surface antigen heavy chain isoform X2 [Hemicordylus capensis]XP_053133662.1 4F2 cell-surface antigen heavy chain isoform X2 [Hemicordylus capensis]
MSSPGVTPEVDMKDVELNEVETEKQPMNASPSPPLAGSPASLGEKNGVVKVKVTEDEEEEQQQQRGGELGAKFTGLSKEELLQVAGTPAWVRTRWALLILFWLGWLGMLAGAIAIIVQAPRCKDLPKQDWWQKGGIYRIEALEKFQDSDGDGRGDLAGLKQRMDYLSSLKVKGVVIGPIHVNSKDNLNLTNLKEIDSTFGTLDQFREVLQAAKKKSLKVVLDLTPNYQSESPWFQPGSPSREDLPIKMKEAIEFWLKEGVSGIQIRSVEDIVNQTQLLDEWKNLTSDYSSDDHARVLITATGRRDVHNIISLLDKSSADLLTSPYLELAQGDGGNASARTVRDMIHRYIQAFGDKWPSWSVGRPGAGQTAAVGEHLLRLYHMLIYTLLGTPFTDYGDEIGLWDLPAKPADSTVIRMRWDDTANFGFSKEAQDLGEKTDSNVTVKSQTDDNASVLRLFQQLSELRGKERALLHGEFLDANATSAHAVAYLRVWDQNKRFLVVLNFAPMDSPVSFAPSPHLPPEAMLELSTDPQREKQQQPLSLQGLQLRPWEGLLLSFPYVA